MFRRLNAVLRPASPASQDSGLSLVEVIVAMMVFSIISLGVAYSIGTSLVLTRESRAREIAANLAAADIDQVRAVEDVMKVVDRTGAKTTVGGTTFTVDRKVSWVPDTKTVGSTDDCGSSAASGAAAVGGALRYKRVLVKVSYDGMRRPGLAVTSQTLLSSDTRLSTPETGTIIVSVKGATGGGTRGVSVTLGKAAAPAGAVVPSAQPEPTDVQGCAYALKVVPGNYTVGIAKTGGVGFDTAGRQITNPSTTVQVKAGASASALFTFDDGALVALTYATAGGTLPSDLDTTFTGSVGSPFALSGASRTARLFPGSYQIVSGRASADCLSPTPAEWSTPDVDGAVGRSAEPVSIAPGGSLVVTAGTGRFDVSSLASDKNYTLRAVSVAGPTAGDPGCKAGPITYTFPSSNQPKQSLALPYGSWKITQVRSDGTTRAVGLSNIALVSRGTVDAAGILQLDPRVVAP